MNPLATGADISSHQHDNGSTVDFAKMRAAGFGFVIIKATQGASYVNPFFAGDMEAARAAGVDALPYHWVSPTSSASAQVLHVLNTLRGVHTPDQGAIGLDFEENGCTHALLDEIRSGLRAAGFSTLTYTYPEFWRYNGKPDCPACAGDPLWWGWPRSVEPTAANVEAGGYSIAPWRAVSVWQYAGTSARVPGIAGLSDADRLLAPVPGITPTTIDPSEDDDMKPWMFQAEGSEEIDSLTPMGVVRVPSMADVETLGGVDAVNKVTAEYAAALKGTK